MNPTTVTPPEAALFWEVVKAVMLTITTGGVLWIARTIVLMKDEVRDLKHIVIGVDGKNGLRSTVTALKSDVDFLNDRNTALDAVAEAERRSHAGPDRRINSRLRDEILDVIDRYRAAQE